MKKLISMFLFVGAVMAQNESKPVPPPEFFRLEFTVIELEGGKQINTRNYQMMAQTGNSVASIRSGGRVPVSQGEKNFTYIDVGMNIDVRKLTRMNDQLSLEVIVDSNGSPDSNTQSGPPVIRQTRWDSTVEVPFRKPTIIFMSDDPASKRQLQLQVTATPVH